MPPSDPGRTKGQRGRGPWCILAVHWTGDEGHREPEEEGLGWEEAKENSSEAKDKG